MNKSISMIHILLCPLFVLGSAHALYSQETINDIIINNRGVQYGESNRLDDAIKEFDKAINLRDRAAAKAYHNKGYALEKKGELREAVKYYEEAWKRNPRQIVTGERLGYTYYKLGECERAAEVGESVLKIDPANRQVAAWIGDARSNCGRKREGTGAGKPSMLYLSLDAMLRMGLYYGNKYYLQGLYYRAQHGFRWVPDDGLIVSVPYTLFMRISPIPLLEISATMENPWLGALMPPGLVVQSEKGEIVFNIKNFQLGTGVMVNHYDSSMAFFKRLVMTDVKVGFILGFKKDKGDARVTWYPRMLIMDKSNSKGKTLDVGSLRIDFSYQLFQDIKLYGLFNFRDYYVFCHSFDARVMLMSYLKYSENIASYWGVYDMGFGVTFNNLAKYADGSELFSLTFEWLERFYLRDLNNDDPYTLAPNGQGWFGLDVHKFTKGKPFPGFLALSQVLSLRFDEQLTKNFFMYQKLIAELADQDSDHHEFNLQIGMGIKF